MKYVIIIVLVIMWLVSVYRFSRQYKFFKRVRAYYEYKHRADPDDAVIAMGLASAYMKTQQYRKAYELYCQLKANGVGDYPGLGDSIDINMAFCCKPVPCCSGPKDLKGSWWHNFVLVRLGGRRRYDFTEMHMLEAEAMMRQGLI